MQKSREGVLIEMFFDQEKMRLMTVCRGNDVLREISWEDRSG